MPMGRRRFVGCALAGTASAAWGAPAPAGRPAAGSPGPQAPARVSTVASVRPEDFPSLSAAVAEAVRLAGGMGFVRPGDSVLLKPAVNSARPYPATADPEVVHALARLVLEAGGRPWIGDRTMFLRSTAVALERTGMLAVARSLGIPCLALDDAETVVLRHPEASHWPGGAVRVYRPAAEADHVVGICTPRTHRLAGFTMAMKNLVGVVAGSARPAMHLGAGFPERLAEISLAVRTALVVLDGRQGFADGGPDQGALCRPGFIAAGADPLAVDAVGLAHLRLVGVNEVLAHGSIWSLPVMRRAAEAGVGAGSADRIRLVGVAPEAAARLRAQLA